MFNLYSFTGNTIASPSGHVSTEEFVAEVCASSRLRPSILRSVRQCGLAVLSSSQALCQSRRNGRTMPELRIKAPERQLFGDSVRLNVQCLKEKNENLADSIGANLSNEGMNLGRRGKPGAELGLLSQEKLRLPENFTESCSNLRFYAQFALPNKRRNRSPCFC